MKQAADLHSPSINQIVMHRVAEQCYDSHAAMLRDAYRKRRDLVLAALAEHMPAGVEWTRPEGGMFIWVTLPEGLDGADLLTRSLETARVAFVPGKAFHADGSGANTIRLSFSLADEHAASEGICAPRPRGSRCTRQRVRPRLAAIRPECGCRTGYPLPICHRR